VGTREIDVRSLGLAIPVMPGQVTVEIEAHGFRPVQRDVSVAAGAVQQVSVTLERAPEWNGEPPTAAELAAELAQRAERRGGHGPSSSFQWGGPVQAPPPWMRPLAWGTLGVGAVGLVGVAAFGGLSLGIYNGVFMRCGGAACPATEQSNIDTGRTFQTLANVSIVVGVVGALGGATLWWLSRDAGGRRATVGFSGNGIVIAGEF
jgi:hypothetical protein